jgi:methylated-DNA-[protein]-cysteine S-methyltransferase
MTLDFIPGAGTRITVNGDLSRARTFTRRCSGCGWATTPSTANSTAPCLGNDINERLPVRSNEVYQARLAAPFATLGIGAANGQVVAIDYLPRSVSPMEPVNALAREVCAQLRAYLQDPRFRFDLPLKPTGTAFQNQVWQAIREIPCGGAATYSDLAWQLGSGAQAVGQACAANRVPMVIPCHRVVAKHGLGGFMRAQTGDPLIIKGWLLAHESSR